jgi:hypothetical protein
MALKKPTPAFEVEPGTDGAAAAVAEAPAQAKQAEAPAPAPTPEPVNAPAAAAEASHAIAKASGTAVAMADAANRAKQFKKEIEEMHGASDFSYGNYPVYKGNNGEICGNNAATDPSMGRWAQVRLMSWDDHYEVSPGETGDSTKDFVAYSKDGKTVDSVIGAELQVWVGKSVDDYANFLRTEEDFTKTKCRRFIDTACAVLANDSGRGPIGKVVQITLSESSIPAFSRYQQGLQDNARCVAMGLPGFSLPDDPFTFFFIREAAQKGTNKWTKLAIVQELPAQI